ATPRGPTLDHMRAVRVVALVVLVSAAFGIADRIVQGHSAAGWYLANVAGAWLAVAFLCGAIARRRGEAALLALAAEMSALVGYYGFKHFVEHQPEPHSHLVLWFALGVVAA